MKMLNRVGGLVVAVGLCAAAIADATTLDLGSAQVMAVTPSIFRIRFGSGAFQSTFVDRAFTVDPGDFGALVVSAVDQKLSTEAGAFDVDPVKHTFRLLGKSGEIVIPASPIDWGSKKTQTDQSVSLAWPADKPFDVYASGNGSHTLVQHAAKAHVGNGVAVEPFFWSPAGYACFVVGSDDNHPAQCDGKITNGAVTWNIPGTSADVYLIVAPTLVDATKNLLTLTGKPPVPPEWTFGYLQSRWGWRDKAYIDDALKQFETRKLPVDAFIFDFEWYTTFPDYSVPPEGAAGFSDFDWNPKLFPDPAAQIDALHAAGVHAVGIRKPRLGNTESLKMVRANGWGLASGQEKFDARGLQFANPDVATWYAKQTEPLLKAGIDGWWDDEGELTYTDYFYWDRAQQIALNAVRPNDRLWTIDRAFSPGLSREGVAAWTGDIQADWKTLLRTPADLLDWSIAGMPYATCDIGGYAGQTNPELLTRWMQAGTFFPVMRAHSQIEAQPHFPWLFGPEVEAAIRNALDLRYRLIPVLYSLADQTHEAGLPLMRPLLMQYPHDPNVTTTADEWMVGGDILAAPVLTPGGHKTIYLPDDVWYDFATGKKFTGGTTERDVPFDAVPVFIRAGAILPMAPVVQHTRDLPGGPLDMRIYPGRDGEFTLVEDDGMTTAYLSGAQRKTTFNWNDATRTLSWKRSGKYGGKDCFTEMKVTLGDATMKALAVQPLAASGSVIVP